MRERVFDPLGITQAGFGPPGHSGKYDQPLGHGEISRQVPLDPADSGSDNPAWIGPAGTINISLKDWAKFAQDQLDGAHGHGKLLQQTTYTALQTPVSEGYALGWGAMRDPDGSLQELTHAGTNGYWVSAIAIYPKKETIILVATNVGGDTAMKSVGDVISSLEARLKLKD